MKRESKILKEEGFEKVDSRNGITFSRVENGRTYTQDTINFGTARDDKNVIISSVIFTEDGEVGIPTTLSGKTLEAVYIIAKRNKIIKGD